ncbi:PTS glucitol/sorbitol transporter subunit IIC [Caproiciproducens sp. CPB-2]|uniref:PTS glucitol/sorbitol transporter subunit IIC n=1 Tax=unclassified Caproiciproducens TaxID=2643836 RepID=UPI0023DCB603|nr:PTS glucitol/sorbitol transporter subunit IIC [Caproiciproducens sp. CPB-2]MDF1493404.1 PTS glucitol/sorbitol transporter subunit IIC [Caproiciproducens sp. CPB-2]
MDFLVKFAEVFTGVFQAGGENLTGLITGILPTLLVLLTTINALIKLIGEKRVNNFAKKLTRFRLLRYTLLPIMSLFFLTNPMCYTMGRFVEEKEKPAFIDACFSFAHPILGIFPHANPGELFVWAGISAGITTLGQSAMPLAVRYFIVGIIVIFIRGNVTELITTLMMKRKGAAK